MENSNIVPNGNENKMMSSKQIAERTGKTHFNVLRDIRGMITELEKDNSNLNSQDYQIVTNLQTGLTTEILLSEKLCLCLASGYSITLRMQIIEDWEELKKQQIETRKLPTNFVEALKELVASEEKIILLEVENQKLKPRSEYFEKMVLTDGLLSMGEVAKLLNLEGTGRNKLFAQLRVANVIQKKDRVPLQIYINKGYFELKEEIIEINNIRKVVPTTYVTQKGLAFIYKVFNIDIKQIA